MTKKYFILIFALIILSYAAGAVDNRLPCPGTLGTDGTITNCAYNTPAECQADQGNCHWNGDITTGHCETIDILGEFCNRQDSGDCAGKARCISYIAEDRSVLKSCYACSLIQFEPNISKCVRGYDCDPNPCPTGREKFYGTGQYSDQLACCNPFDEDKERTVAGKAYCPVKCISPYSKISDGEDGTENEESRDCCKEGREEPFTVMNGFLKGYPRCRKICQSNEIYSRGKIYSDYEGYTDCCIKNIQEPANRPDGFPICNDICNANQFAVIGLAATPYQNAKKCCDRVTQEPGYKNWGLSRGEPICNPKCEQFQTASLGLPNTVYDGMKQCCPITQGSSTINPILDEDGYPRCMAPCGSNYEKADGTGVFASTYTCCLRTHLFERAGVKTNGYPICIYNQEVETNPFQTNSFSVYTTRKSEDKLSDGIGYKLGPEGYKFLKDIKITMTNEGKEFIPSDGISIQHYETEFVNQEWYTKTLSKTKITITPDAPAVISLDDISLEIPAGAVSTPVDITIEKIDMLSKSPVNIDTQSILDILKAWIVK